MTAARPAALITGASSGIGAAFARVFAAHGHEVVLTARREAELRTIADSLSASGHKPAHVVAVDLTAPDAASRIDDALQAEGLEAQYVVNNAGFGLLGRAQTLGTDQLAMIDLNVRVLTDLSVRFLDSLARHRGGILNVASIASFLPGPGMSVYHATKAYVLSFSEGLRRELKPKGVRVTVLCPGPVLTGFQTRANVCTDHYPAGFIRSADHVARAGYEGLMRGRAVVVPGMQNKIVPWLPRLLPRTLLADTVYARLRTWDDV